MRCDSRSEELGAAGEASWRESLASPRVLYSLAECAVTWQLDSLAFARTLLVVPRESHASDRENTGQLESSSRSTDRTRDHIQPHEGCSYQ